MSAPSSDQAGIRQTIRALRDAEHIVYGGNDGEADVTYAPDASEDDIIADMTACDSSTLWVRLPDGTTSFVFFVLGNDPEEVICDHGVSLSPVLDPLTEKWATESPTEGASA